MKTEDANELNLGGKAGPSAVGVHAGKKKLEETDLRD